MERCFRSTRGMPSWAEATRGSLFCVAGELGALFSVLVVQSENSPAIEAIFGDLEWGPQRGLRSSKTRGQFRKLLDREDKNSSTEKTKTRGPIWKFQRSNQVLNAPRIRSPTGIEVLKNSLGPTERTNRQKGQNRGKRDPHGLESWGVGNT
jgi:hypothetical protein